jgi:hypothetical protein
MQLAQKRSDEPVSCRAALTIDVSHVDDIVYISEIHM